MPQVLLCGRKAQTVGDIAHRLRAGSLVHASWIKARHALQPWIWPWESTVAKDKGTKAPLNDPGEQWPLLFESNSFYLLVWAFHAACLSWLTFPLGMFQLPAACTFHLLFIYSAQSCPRCRCSSHIAQDWLTEQIRGNICPPVDLSALSQTTH